jgi:5-oxoprolinase (ATP-hydrolysing) subunit C
MTAPPPAGALKVLAPGLHTRVVDRGRPGWRALGVPVGGAADSFSLAVGNALVGNPPGAAALEVNLAGPTVESTCELGCVVFGAPFELHAGARRLTPGTTFTLPPGEALHVGGAAEGVRAYLCVRGGLLTPVVLGSRSALGPLEAGEELPCTPGTTHGRFVRVVRDWEAPPEPGPPTLPLRVLPGAQSDWFEPSEFYGQTFTVGPSSDRMGLRLGGTSLSLPGRELLSEPVCPGAVQVTREGQCIVLGVDGQTIGGYPKVAQVISADLDRVGQLRPGQAVRFVRVRLDEAEALYRRRQEALRLWLTRLRCADPLGERRGLPPPSGPPG